MRKTKKMHKHRKGAFLARLSEKSACNIETALGLHIGIWSEGEKKTPWRNGSASDSRSEGCVFKSRRGQKMCEEISFSIIF